MISDTGQFSVVVSNSYRIPLVFCSTIVDICECRTIPDCTNTDASNGVWKNNRFERGAAIE